MEKECRQILENWKEEKDAAFLYRAVSRIVRRRQHKKVLSNLARIEEGHAEIWREELVKCNIKPKFRPSIKSRIFIFVIKVFGEGAMHEILRRNEYSKIRLYFKQLQTTDKQTAVHDKAKHLFVVEKGHSNVLHFLKTDEIDAFEGSAWHKGSGSIRDVIFGMNDGLLSTFSVVAGLAGGRLGGKEIFFGGLAAAVAGAFSMAAGAFVSVRAEREVYEKQLEIERKELELMPEAEHEELRKLYRSKGMSQSDSEKIASTIMNDKDVALDTMAKEELGFAPDSMASPYKAAFFSGVSFILGACIPLLPVSFSSADVCIYVSAAFSGIGFFLIGATRTIVTGKRPFSSGMEMFLIGVSAAVLTFIIGSFASRFFL